MQNLNDKMREKLNKKFKIKLVVAFVSIIFTCSPYSFSMTKTGMTAAPFLSIEVGARGKSMGGAFVGISDDISALFWNPAGITKLPKNAFMISHTKWIADVNFNFAGVTVPLGNYGAIGASLTSLTMDDMKVRTVYEQDGTGEYFSANDLALSLAYGMNLTDRFAIGFNVKYIQQQIYKMSASTYAVDFGTLFRTNFNDMVIGMSISNFGGSMQLSGIDTEVDYDVSPDETGNNDKILANLKTDPFQLPLTFRVGVAMDVIKLKSSRLKVAVDAVVPNDNAQYMNLGMEYIIADLIALRGGYKSLFLKDSEEGLTLGAGLQHTLGGFEFSLDYAYGDFGLLSYTQELMFSIYF